MSDFVVVPCDGCLCPVPANELSYHRVNGQICRYCPDCAAIFEQFHQTVNAEHDRLSALHDLFIESARRALPLKLTPFDLPTVLWGDDKAGPLRLG